MNKRIIYTAIVLLLSLYGVQAQNTANLVLADASCDAGTTITMTLSMTGCAAGFQANVYMPDGCTITKVSRGSVTKVRDDNDEYIYTFGNSDYDDGSKFLLCYSALNIATEKAGDVAVLTVNVDKNMMEGVYDIVLKNTECSYGSDILSTYTECTAKLTVLNLATSINDVNSIDDSEVYNISGQKLNSTSRGLNIVKTCDGVRKVTVK